MTPEIFLESFGYLAGTPGAVKRLRELILQLAVMGKLVPQDPRDEPASVLLKKIAAEKAQLVKEGKIHKPNPLPPIKPEEVPFDLPEGWEFERIGNLLQISSGNFLPSKQMAEDGTISVYGGNGITGYHDRSNVSEETLVIGRVGYYCGSIHITPERAWVTDNAFITAFPKNHLNFQFLYWLLKATDLKKDDNATAQPVISGRKVYPIIVPLPPFSEQRRIVERVDQLMALCDRLEERETQASATHKALSMSALYALTTADGPDAFQTAWSRIRDHFDPLFITPESVKALRQTILQLAVMGKLVPQEPNDKPASVLLKKIAAEKVRLVKEGKIRQPKPLPPIKPEEAPFELPQGWEWVRLEDVSTKIHYGYTASADHSTQNVRLLRITDIQDNKVDWETVPGCNARKEDVDQYLLADNDILIARTGGTVGKTYLVQGINVDAVFASYLIRVIPSARISVRFVKYFAEGPLYWKQLYAACSGTGQPNVNGRASRAG